MELSLFAALIVTALLAYNANKEKNDFKELLELFRADYKLESLIHNLLLNEQQRKNLTDLKKVAIEKAEQELRDMGFVLSDDKQLIVLKTALTHVKTQSTDEPTLDELDWINLNYHRVFSDAEFVKLKEGYKSKDMDTKWNLYFDNGDYILERSWTKTPVFKLVINDKEAVAAYTKFPKESDDWERFNIKFINEVLDLFFENGWD